MAWLPKPLGELRLWLISEIKTFTVLAAALRSCCLTPLSTGPFTQLIVCEGSWSVGQHTNTSLNVRRVKCLTRRKAYKQHRPNLRSTEETSLRLSQDDESNQSVPCALALWKYVDKRARGVVVVCAMFSPVRQKLWAAGLTAVSALLSVFSSFKPRERTKAKS